MGEGCVLLVDQPPGRRGVPWRTRVKVAHQLVELVHLQILCGLCLERDTLWLSLLDLSFILNSHTVFNRINPRRSLRPVHACKLQSALRLLATARAHLCIGYVKVSQRAHRLVFVPYWTLLCTQVCPFYRLCRNF